MKQVRTCLLVIVATIFTGCISTYISPIERRKIDRICIKENPKVIRPRIMRFIVEELQQRGIETDIYRGDQRPDCTYVIEYTARWRWDFALYLAYARVSLFENNKLLGYTEYDGMNAGLALTKFKTDREKMMPLLRELFSNLN